jgi:hypothetical protein
VKRITQVFKDLMTPDDQAQSWYGWATNQMSHAFLGAVISAIVGVWGILVVVAIAVIKEGFDVIKGAKLLDALLDVAFWVLGAVATHSGYVWAIPAAIVLAVILTLGVRKRIPR